MRDQLGGAFREAVAQFPEAFAQLDRSVQNMSAAAAAQSESTLEAAGGLQRGVDGLTAAAAQIAPVAELLHTATAELRSMPDQLGRTFVDVRETWAQEMRTDQEAFLGSVRAVLEGQQNASAEFMAAAEGLPAAFSREVEQIAERLGKEFSRGAQEQAEALAKEMRGGADRLRQAFSDARETWASGMQADREAFQGSVEALQKWERERGEAAREQREAWRETVERVQKASAEFVDTAKGLPAAFTREVNQISEQLGKDFSIGAQQHIGDLVQEMRGWALPDQIRESMRDLQNRLLHDTSRVVGESAEEVHRRVGEPLLAQLESVSRGIGEAVDKLPEHAKSFAASMSEVDAKLQQSIERLQKSAEHLKGAAEDSKNLQATLTGAFEKGATRSFDSIRDDLQEVAKAMNRVASRTSRMRGLARRIARLFKRGDKRP